MLANREQNVYTQKIFSIFFPGDRVSLG